MAQTGHNGVAMPAIPPRRTARLIGLSLRLSRLVLGLTQEQTGELLGLSEMDRKQGTREYEQGKRRPAYDRFDKLIDIMERACTYAAEVHGAPGHEKRMPQANDPQYALKLFRYWQEHDGTRSGLRRLIPYLAPERVRRRFPRPVPNGRILSTDEVELHVPDHMLRPRARAGAQE